MKFWRAVIAAVLMANAGYVAAQGGTEAARLPFKQTAVQEDALIRRALMVFLLACGVAGGAIYVIKRHGVGWPVLAPRAGAALSRARRLERVETLRLSTKSTLFVIRHVGQELLIVEHGNGVEVLSTSRKAAEDCYE
jgi:hypothetical protein